ncbi:hypothetical protein J7E99_23365 [Streptomyces sp. ISL-44]|uniref:hypothetical protein n=1 Tax=Streptomyces sp. ISL-44 TaxID=2819184 RepID=UPI001BE67DE7|nr:hypothetical protein [Streptomyces sp. ISL-44]MBT2543549.1 hypothetical protein [Streptomyces sp. ISL-44]
MTDLIARFARLLVVLLPARGKHRSTVAPEPAPTPFPQPRRPLPEHKSPYAREAARGHAFVDTINPVRPYVTASPRRRPDDPERRAQAERRWALDMALRGIDVGPTVIHGRQVRPDSRASRVAAGA